MTWGSTPATGVPLPMVLLYLATGGTRFNHWCSASRLVLLSQLLYLDSPMVAGDFVPLWKSLLKLSTPVPAYTWLEGGEYAWSLKGMNTAPSYSKCFDSLLPRIYKALHRCLSTKLGKPLRFFKVPCPQLPRIGMVEQVPWKDWKKYAKVTLTLWNINKSTFFIYNITK